MSMYGGGQWELGPGRGHIQYLASVFHPSTPNDVAPAAFNIHRLDPPPGLPTSPLPPVTRIFMRFLSSSWVSDRRLDYTVVTHSARWTAIR
jgi:hypothetical protein